MKFFLFLLIFLGCVSLPKLTQAATLGTSVSDATLTVGQSVTVTVRVSSSSQHINSAEGSLFFPSNLLQVSSVSRSGSIFTFWAVEPTASSGKVSFSGGLPSPGYKGAGAKVFHVTFKAKATGTATITLSGARVLANDGYGTNVLTSASGASLTISEAGTTPVTPAPPGRPAPVLTIKNFPSGTTWYNQTEAVVSWTKPSGYLGSSVVFDQRANTVPGQSVSTTASSGTFTLTSDGVWYIHVRHQYQTGWGPTTTATLRRDTTPPDIFSVNTERDGDSDATPTLTFSATDTTSGIAGYTMTVDGGAAKQVASPHTTVPLTAGKHAVAIIARDHAGNTRIVTVDIMVTGYSAPVIQYVSSPIVLLDSVTVRGTAQAGDTIALFLDGKPLGTTASGSVDATAAKDGVIVTTPWFFSTDQLIRPGKHELTATATNADGRSSIPTDPVTLFVTGSTILIGGRPVATIAFAPIAVVVVGALILLNLGFMMRLWWSFRRLYQRETAVESELEVLRRRLHRERLTADDVDQELYGIELDLAGKRKAPAKRPRRRKSAS